MPGSLMSKVSSPFAAPSETASGTFNDIMSGMVLFGTLEQIVFNIPFFQRTYIWEANNQVRILIEEILCRNEFDWTTVPHENRKQSLKNKYMPVLGSLTLQESDYLGANTVLVIDGQQRVTTMLLLMICCISELLNSLPVQLRATKGVSYTKGFMSLLRKDNSAPGAIEDSFLIPSWEMHNNDASFFYKLLKSLESGNANSFLLKKKLKSHTPIELAFSKCYELVQNSVESWVQSGELLYSANGRLIPNELQKAEFFYRLLNKITHGVNLSVCLYSKERDGSFLYETLNNRGVHMADHEKIKNLFSALLLKVRVLPGMSYEKRREIESKIASEWDFLLKILERGENVDTFLCDFVRAYVGFFPAVQLLDNWLSFSKKFKENGPNFVSSQLNDFSLIYSNIYVKKPKEAFDFSDAPRHLKDFADLPVFVKNIKFSRSLGLQKASSSVVLFALMHSPREDLIPLSEEIVSLAAASMICNLGNKGTANSPVNKTIMGNTLIRAFKNLEQVKNGQVRISEILHNVISEKSPDFVNRELLTQKLATANLSPSLSTSIRALLSAYFNKKMKGEHSKRGDATLVSPLLNNGLEMNVEHAVPVSVPKTHPAFHSKNKIGNLWLMDASKNKSQKALPYKDKYNNYKDCALRTTRKLYIKALSSINRLGYVEELKDSFINRRSWGLSSAIVKAFVNTSDVCIE